MREPEEERLPKKGDMLGGSLGWLRWAAQDGPVDIGPQILAADRASGDPFNLDATFSRNLP